MADKSIWVRAWQQTELKGPKKVFGSLGVALTTLWVTYEAHLRPLHATCVFMACAIAAYIVMTSIEVLGHAVSIGIRQNWNRLLSGLKEQIASSVREAVKARQTTNDRQLSETQKNKLVELLKPQPGQILVLSALGNPEAFRFASQFTEVFKQAGWNTQQASVSAPFIGLCFLHREPIPANDMRVACAALVASDIAYTVGQSDMTVIHWNQCALFVGGSD